MQAGLSWPEARELALSGSNVRRAQWADRWIFAPRGVLFWLENIAGSTRVVQAGDFQRPEFLARDWTDAAVDQNRCVGLPPLEATLTLSPTSVVEGDASTATLSIPGPLVVDSLFSVTTHPVGRAVHVATVTIPAGSTSITFAVTTIDVDLPSGIIVTAASDLFGVAQAALSVEGVVTPPPSVPWVGRFVRAWGGFPGVGFGVGPPSGFFSIELERQAIAANVRANGAAVTNPFSTAATVTLEGSVTGVLLLYIPSPTITGSSFSITISSDPIRATLPLSFVIPGGGSFTIWARGAGSNVFETAGYEVTATISV